MDEIISFVLLIVENFRRICVLALKKAIFAILTYKIIPL